MVSSISVTWGDFLLGMTAVIESTASTGGTSDVTFRLTAHMRAKLHVYGQGTNIDGLTLYDTAATWTDDNNVFVDYNNADDTSVFPTSTYPNSNVDGWADDGTGAILEAYHMYVAWQNPDSSGAVTYDGIEVKAYATITPNAAYASDADLIANAPSMTMQLMDNSTTGQQFDIHPGSAYASSQVEDEQQGVGVNNIELADDTVVVGDTDICDEYWQLTATAITCVQMTVAVKRSRNTGDSAHDIILDYSNTYSMHAAIGRIADTSDLSLQLGTQDVDFTQFVESGST